MLQAGASGSAVPSRGDFDDFSPPPKDGPGSRLKFFELLTVIANYNGQC